MNCIHIIVYYDLAIHKRCTPGQVSRQLPSANIYPAVTQTIAVSLARSRVMDLYNGLLFTGQSHKPVMTGLPDTPTIVCVTAGYIFPLGNSRLT